MLQVHEDERRRSVRLLVPFPVLADLSSPWSVDARLPAPVELYTWLAEHDHRLIFTEHVRARTPIGDETTSLHIPPGTALLVVTRLAATADQPIAIEEVRVPGDAAQVDRPHGPPQAADAPPRNAEPLGDSNAPDSTAGASLIPEHAYSRSLSSIQFQARRIRCGPSGRPQAA
jgi:hypothetical protein